MTPVNDKIIVSCSMKQKDTMKIGDIEVSTAIRFETNYREKSPTVACVVEGNAYVKEGDILLCHHNTFYTPSPYYLYDNLFSIPATGKLIFAIVGADGKLKPVFDNIICTRVEIPSLLPLPPEKIKTYTDRAIVKDAGLLPYKKDQLIFHRPSAGYDIVYIYNGVESRVTKVPAEQVTGFVSGKK
jgi:hypothetical protein